MAYAKPFSFVLKPNEVVRRSQMSATTKDMSALQMSIRYKISENTARLFMHKVREAMKSKENDGIKGMVQIDEFTVGGSYHVKKKKIDCAIELTDEGKVKRFYALKIEDFSSNYFRQTY